MKKTIFTFAIAMLSFLGVQSLSAQEFNQGTNVVNAGLGFGAGDVFEVVLRTLGAPGRIIDPFGAPIGPMCPHFV